MQCQMTDQYMIDQDAYTHTSRFPQATHSPPLPPTQPPSTHPPAPWTPGNALQINRLMITGFRPFIGISEKAPFMRMNFRLIPPLSPNAILGPEC